MPEINCESHRGRSHQRLTHLDRSLTIIQSYNHLHCKVCGVDYPINTQEHSSWPDIIYKYYCYVRNITQRAGIALQDPGAAVRHRALVCSPGRFNGKFLMYDDAEYLRAQAKLCLDMSRQMSGLADKAHFEKQAMQYSLRAERLKAKSAVQDDDDR